ncbi:hypothetical protein C6P40_004665 [Pichia californica]|uniref:Major facilitator superfamily (MFS) profile domain-containing protein n=1 Tax=Pichia californica TaxID=460514 RepID=A0A9P7BH77_9ASCO|nr:hypothetical protein C6P42_005126 [[Candida] californica]KAG0689674.1 hypothetical protein C6P40_004665 [[Candida] californica]
MSESEVSSVDSVIPHTQQQQQQQQQEQEQQKDGAPILHQTSNNILTRTETIISCIKEDNKFAKTQVEPNPSYDPNDLVRVGTAKSSLDEKQFKRDRRYSKNVMFKENPDLENIKSESDGDDDNNEEYQSSNNNNINNFIDSNENDTVESTLVEDTGEYNVFDIQNKPPDGGFWAWTAAVCVMFINTFSWGANAVFGVYLNYYTSTDYFPGATTEQYVMIGGLGLGLSFMACTITNSLSRKFYYKIIMSIGTALTFLSYWLASISETVVQLIMFQGLMMAIGWALTAGSTFVILPTWFLKKRSIAQGIATAGGGLGGIIFSRPVDEIIKKYTENPKYANNQHEAVKLGMMWSLRMQSLVCGFMLILSIFLIRTYRPIKDPNSKNSNIFKEITAFLFRFDLIKMCPMICLILWNMIYGLTYTILLFSLSSYATTIGLSYKQGSNVTTVQSVAQTIGRPLLGLVSDKIGRVNTTVIFTLILTILVFFFWIFITTYSELLAFAFLAGLILGVNWVNFGPMTADIVGGGGQDLSHAISIQMFTGGMPLLIAELVGLKLKRPEMGKPFLYCQILCGVASIVSAALLMPFREWKVKRILNARRNQFLSRVYNPEDLEKDDTTVNEGIHSLQSNNHILKNTEDFEEDEQHVKQEIDRLNALLQNSIYAYIFRMFYPIAV